jgi:hypothetical protein
MDDDNSPGMIAFRAFEKERQKDFADSIDAIPVDISALRKAMGLMVNEDMRFIPVIACAFADDHLDAMFKKFLPDNIPGGKRRMLESSISNLFNRIQFAFAFDMVHPDVLQALDKLRGYRNKIAHTWDQDTLPDFVGIAPARAALLSLGVGFRI